MRELVPFQASAILMTLSEPLASLVVLVTGGHSELEPFRDSHEPAMQKIASQLIVSNQTFLKGRNMSLIFYTEVKAFLYSFGSSFFFTFPSLLP